MKRSFTGSTSEPEIFNIFGSSSPSKKINDEKGIKRLRFENNIIECTDDERKEIWKTNNGITFIHEQFAQHKDPLSMAIRFTTLCLDVWRIIKEYMGYIAFLPGEFRFVIWHKGLGPRHDKVGFEILNLPVSEEIYLFLIPNQSIRYASLSNNTLFPLSDWPSRYSDKTICRCSPDPGCYDSHLLELQFVDKEKWYHVWSAYSIQRKIDFTNRIDGYQYPVIRNKIFMLNTTDNGFYHDHKLHYVNGKINVSEIFIDLNSKVKREMYVEAYRWE